MQASTSADGAPDDALRYGIVLARAMHRGACSRALCAAVLIGAARVLCGEHVYGAMRHLSICHARLYLTRRSRAFEQLYLTAPPRATECSPPARLSRSPCYRFQRAR